MPIGAIVAGGAALVGAGASILSSSKAAKAQKEASQTAADTTLQVAQENNAFAQQMYDQNAGRLDPYSNMGLAAGGDLMSLLLGPAPNGSWSKSATPATTPTAPTSPTAPGAPVGSGVTPGAGPQGGPVHTPSGGLPGNQTAMPMMAMAQEPTPAMAPTNALAAVAPTGAPASPVPAVGDRPFVPLPNRGEIPKPIDFHGDHQAYQTAMDQWRRTDVSTPAVPPTPGAPPPAGTPPPTTGGAHPAAGALSAWDTFYNSPAFQLPLNEALKGINTKYAAAGAIESGAAMKAIGNYEHDYAAGVLGQYMDQLYKQEALGAQAASSLAGVGTTLVNQVSANNTNAGNAAANAALAQGQASAGNWNNIGGAIGQAAGAIGGAFGSSYPVPAAPQGPITVWNTGL